MFLDAVWSGARAFLKGVVQLGRSIVHEVLEEIDKSAIGQAVTRVIHGYADKAFSKTKELAEEERELAEKLLRDGRRSASDDERLLELNEERERIRKEVEKQDAAQAAAELRQRAEEVGQHAVNDDELSFNSGLLSSKTCSCGGVMTIRQGAINEATGQRNFFWACTSKPHVCKPISFDPRKEPLTIVRPSDAELDMPTEARRAAWNHPDVLKKSHERLRGHLDEEDNKVLCPHHVTPMRLMQRRGAGGRLLDSYEYVCTGVHADGRFCAFTEPVKTMPQVAALFHRKEGSGILD